MDVELIAAIGAATGSGFTAAALTLVRFIREKRNGKKNGNLDRVVNKMENLTDKVDSLTTAITNYHHAAEIREVRIDMWRESTTKLLETMQSEYKLCKKD